MSKWTPGKWTPGKWIPRSDHSGDWNVFDSNGEAVVGNEGLYRCDGQDEHNARLIAAAPEMAELLDRANSALQTNDDEAASELAAEIRALLAKVEGK